MVRVLTGNAGNSLKFWEDLRKLSDEAIDLIETELGGDEDENTSMASSKVEWR
jgi:hypothetical protein